MNGSTASQIPVPSAGKLAVTTAIALAVAVLILVTIVLPAEYGVDPLGTGERLGLTVMSRPQQRKPAALPADGGELKPTSSGPISQYPVPFKVDRVEFTIAPYDYIEYKYQLAAGAQMAFSWQASAPVSDDFHGEVNADPNQVQSFDASNFDGAHGLFTAPFNGIHGWYWENPTGKPVTVTLQTSGFYASAIEFRSDKTTVPHELKTP